LTFFDPATSSWRTFATSLLATAADGSEEFSGTWPRAGMTRSGTASRLRPLAPLTAATGSGSLPTPSATSYGSNRGGAAGRVGPVRPSLQTMAAKNLWPTPNGRDWKDTGPSQGNRKSPNLGTVAHWRTPQARDGDQRGPSDPQKRVQQGHSVSLHDQVGGSLNPTWVEWLMGFPAGWSQVEELTPAASRKRAQRAHPTMTSCERCGSTWRLQRHHKDIQLAESVEILCQTCHIEADFQAGTRKRRVPKTCVVCEAIFTEYSHSRVKCCSPACLSELGRQNARKRWDGGIANPRSPESPTASLSESTDLEPSGTASSPRSPSGSASASSPTSKPKKPGSKRPKRSPDAMCVCGHPRSAHHGTGPCLVAVSGITGRDLDAKAKGSPSAPTNSVCACSAYAPKP
jgi:hypothetical protein